MTDSNSNGMNPASLSDLAGRRLGDYQVIRRLGRGAMAEVYLAEQVSLGRRVAIKFLKSELAKDDTYVKRFQNEARSAASLVHANIVQIYEVGYSEGLHYIAQEYVPGTNLSDLLTRKGSLDVAFGLAVFRQTIAALIKSADQGIVHRDIKPENILVNQTGEVKVADFGLARVIDKDQTLNLTQVGVTMGTPLYMSPEQVEGKPLDTRSDLYSLGITMYHVLTGLPPFRGDNALVVAMKHLKEQPDRLENLRPDLPAGLCRIVHKMIEKKPQSRYQAARALLVELRALYKELGAENWSEDWNEWTSGELTSLNDSRSEATSQLGELMQTQALLTQKSNWTKRIAALVLCGFAIGLTTAWATRQPYLLKEQGQESEIANQETAQQQKIFAMFYKGGKDITAWEKIEQRFPGEKNQTYHLDAKRELAKLNLENKNYPAALKYFQELKGYANKSYKLYGMTGEAIIYDIQKNPATETAWANLETERNQIKNDKLKPSHPDEYLGSDMTALYNNQVEARRARANVGAL